MEEIMVLIGRRIKFLRMERNMQQIQLAKMIGVSQTHLSNLESGRSGLTIPNLIKMRQIFDCPISEFFLDIEGAVPAIEPNIEEIQVDDLIKIAKLLKTLK